ncbi:MAG: hypothetical protein JSV80_02555, partial [Acidobacteriota bacterium]
MNSIEIRKGYTVAVVAICALVFGAFSVVAAVEDAPPPDFADIVEQYDEYPLRDNHQLDRCDPDAPFDEPFTDLLRIEGAEYHTAMSGIGTKDGARSFTIDVGGTPVAAWLYWSGELRPDFGPDECITLSGGALAAPEEICGIEVGRRLQLFNDEDQGGESVMRGEVPLYAFLQGANTF